jgi:hypothetical protein
MSTSATITDSAGHTGTRTLPACTVRICLAFLVFAALLASGYLVARTMDARPVPVMPATVIAPIAD